MKVGQVWALGDGPELEERNKAFADREGGLFQGFHPNPFSDPGFSAWLYGIDVFAEADTEWEKINAAE